jgi:cob(I)alamin adenosyltransferase
MPGFYTRTGDNGYTGLLGEERVPKEHPVPEALGALDEATAALGLARGNCKAPSSADILLAVQRDLYQVMVEVAASPHNIHRFGSLSTDRVTWLETQVDELSATVEVPDEFIVPGDSPAGAALDLARTIVRRAERRLAQLVHDSLVEGPECLRYLNRLSSLLFVLELVENQAAGIDKPTLARIDR